MNHGNFLAFEALNQRLDDLTLLVAAIATELSEDAEVKALAATLKDRIANLQAALSASAGTTPPQ